MSAPAVDVVVRPLVAADLSALDSMERTLFGVSAWSRQMLADELVGPGRTYVGAERPGGSLVGYAGMWFDGRDVQIMTVATDTGYQGRGIARRMLVTLLEQARALGAESVLLEVRVDNAPAIHLYETLGFTRLGCRRGYYQPENVDAWTMQLLLPSAAQARQDVS
ncbi:ribosomal protein S18-alanine N-acetyltransferase [Cellulomonas xiejunii]|uniref:ribosomal protein S18-alanine N-acetyltransferase n=1 Tax=Cellulomonas xiejunii TaxID=2968083 RepID=UPI001D0E6917|nr:ribosomal protein S18-alanine N-acetyltransferase [Cellulomonas xiejunii]MCC2312689.1 ribosomal protein S18-alanine N-acetyltransferase [Cellulomonas xiejunii]